MNLSLDLLRESDITVENNQLIFTGKVDFPLHGKGGVSFQGRIAVVAENGSVEADKQEVKISNADAVTLLIDVRTDYKNPDYKELCMKTVNDVSRKSYKILKQSHIEDYSRLFNRVELNLGQWYDSYRCSLETGAGRKS